MVYIGMKPAESTIGELQRELDIAYQKRKQEQVCPPSARRLRNHATSNCGTSHKCS